MKKWVTNIFVIVREIGMKIFMVTVMKTNMIESVMMSEHCDDKKWCIFCGFGYDKVKSNNESESELQEDDHKGLCD